MEMPILTGLWWLKNLTLFETVYKYTYQNERT